MSIQTLTGSQGQAGSAIDNTQTDEFALYGSSNYVLEQAGNVTINSGASPIFLKEYGADTNTTIRLGGTDVLDTITISGGNNKLLNATVAGSVPLSGSTVTFTVTDNGICSTPRWRASVWRRRKPLDVITDGTIQAWGASSSRPQRAIA